MMATTFWSPDGKPMSADADSSKSCSANCRASSRTRTSCAGSGASPTRARRCWRAWPSKGFGDEQLSARSAKLIDAEKSDVFDVLAYIAFALARRSRARSGRRPRKRAILAALRRQAAGVPGFRAGAIRQPGRRKNWTGQARRAAGAQIRVSERCDRAARGCRHDREDLCRVSASPIRIVKSAQPKCVRGGKRPRY